MNEHQQGRTEKSLKNPRNKDLYEPSYRERQLSKTRASPGKREPGHLRVFDVPNALGKKKT